MNNTYRQRKMGERKGKREREKENGT